MDENTGIQEMKPISKLDAAKAYFQMHKKSILTKTAVVAGAIVGVAAIAYLSTRETDETIDAADDVVDSVLTDGSTETVESTTTEVVA